MLAPGCRVAAAALDGRNFDARDAQVEERGGESSEDPRRAAVDLRDQQGGGYGSADGGEMDEARPYQVRAAAEWLFGLSTGFPRQEHERPVCARRAHREQKDLGRRRRSVLAGQRRPRRPHRDRVAVGQRSPVKRGLERPKVSGLPYPPGDQPPACPGRHPTPSRLVTARRITQLSRSSSWSIPIEIRERLGLVPGTIVDFEVEGEAVRMTKAKNVQDRGSSVVGAMRGRGDVKLSTDEVMALTRGE